MSNSEANQTMGRKRGTKASASAHQTEAQCDEAYLKKVAEERRGTVDTSIDTQMAAGDNTFEFPAQPVMELRSRSAVQEDRQPRHENNGEDRIHNNEDVKIQLAVQRAVKDAMQEVMQTVNGAMRDIARYTLAETQPHHLPDRRRGETEPHIVHRRMREEFIPEREYQDNSDSTDADVDNIPHSPHSSTPRTRSLNAEPVPRATNVKLPPFNGKQKWKVWFNRFTEIAERYQWSSGECLNQMLPKLQGDAGEFVFGELPKRIRSNYPELIAELENRFRKIETPKSYTVTAFRKMERVQKIMQRN